MKKKVIFFIESKFNRRDYHRFGFDILKANGFDVWVWDFSPWLRPDYNKSYTAPDEINYRNIKYLNSREEFCDNAPQIASRDIVIVVVGNNYRSRPIFRYISKKNINWGVAKLGLIPGAHGSVFKKIIYNIDLLYDYSKLKNFIIEKFYRINSKNPEPKFFITGGNIAAQIAHSTYPSAEIIKAHSFDYDRYLEFVNAPNRTNSNISSKKLAVFLDEFGPYHPDFSHAGIKPYMDEDTYFPELNRFFSYLEDQFGLEVVIAAHPRSDYHISGMNPYDGRKCYWGETINLVQKSKLVLTHESTSKSFAVLYYKPMLFLTSMNYSKVYRNNIKTAASEFGKPPVELYYDKSGVGKELYSINIEKYDNYISKYIKEKGTPEEPVWEIVAKYLKILK